MFAKKTIIFQQLSTVFHWFSNEIIRKHWVFWFSNAPSTLGGGQNSQGKTGFSGFNGGYLKKNSDISIHVSAKNYGISEDAHHILMHVILQYLIKSLKK